MSAPASSPVAERFRAAPVVLTDGGIETRLIYEYRLELPEFASFLALFHPGERGALETIYRSYLTVAAEFGQPMQIGTPTWRAHPECLARLGFTDPGDLRRVNRAAVQLLHDLREEADLADLVLIAGVIGPRHDGYDPAGAPDAEASRAYHQAQAEVLAELGVDLLYAPTFASAEELLGVAQAMAATGLPYALAPVIDAEGRLRDGTRLAALVERIDGTVRPPPLHYLAGCVHPTLVRTAETAAAEDFAAVGARFAGLKANASTLPPDQLDQLHRLDSAAPAPFARAMLGLNRDFGLRVLGGCCGTDDRHIRAIAEMVDRSNGMRVTGPRPAVGRQNGR